MRTRQTIVMALMAFASIAKCQMSAMDDDDECSPTTAAAQPSILAPTAPASFVNSIFSPATPTEVATPSSDPSSAQRLSGACAPDGMFNCVGGSQYQQCSNGKWAPLIPLEAKCSEGQSMTLWRRDVGSEKDSFQRRRRAN
ncbi:hypothetical protein F4679DRAFT_578461 [Xylaria curta]|nr:hypothetical protein F4679DRAFT_578461 [Xylaria curta]